MKQLLLLLAVSIVALAACSPAQQAKIIKAEQTPAGALFCRVQLAGGGPFLANVIQVSTASFMGSAAPVVALATNAGKQIVDQTCQDAATAAGGGIGTAVSPPADLNTRVMQIAVAALAGPTTVTVAGK